MTGSKETTWVKFVMRVDALLYEARLDRNMPLEAINWDIKARGGPVPDIFVQIDPDTGRLQIGED